MRIVILTDDGIVQATLYAPDFEKVSGTAQTYRGIENAMLEAEDFKAYHNREVYDFYVDNEPEIIAQREAAQRAWWEAKTEEFNHPKTTTK